MKRFNKLFIILLCCVGAMSVTSCLDSDDGYSLDPELVRQYYTQMSGPYNGGTGLYANKVYFYNDTITDKNNTSKTDSLSGYGLNGGVVYTTTLAGRDSVSFVLNGVSGRVLAKEIDGEQHKGLKEAIENAGNLQIKGQIAIYNIQGQVAYMYFYPMSVELKGLNYDGGTHDVTIYFWYPGLGYYFMQDAHKVLQFPLVMASIWVDGNETVKIYDGSSYDETAYRKALLSVQLCD